MTRDRKHRKDLNGHVSLNKIQGSHYLYFHYSDDEGKPHTEYLGPLTPETQMKAKQRQMEQLQHVKQIIDQRLSELQTEIVAFEEERRVARKVQAIKT